MKLYGFDVILFDINHQFLLTDYYSIYFYNTETKKWTELKIATVFYGGNSGIVMVVNEGNVELLSGNILKNVADKIDTLKLVGDSGELTKVAQSLEDTNIEIKTINIATEIAAKYKFAARHLSYDYFESSASCVAKPQCFTGDATFDTCCFNELLFTLKETKNYSSLCSKFIIVSLSLSFSVIQEQIASYNIDIFETFAKKLLITNTTASLKELEVDLSFLWLSQDKIDIIRLVKVTCTILEKTPLEVVNICGDKQWTVRSTAVVHVLKLLYEGLLNLTTLKVLIIEEFNEAFDELMKVILHLAAGNTHSVVVFDDCSFSSHQYREILDKAIISTGNIKEIYIREGELSTVEAIKELPLNIDANCRIILSHWPYEGTSDMNSEVSSQQITIIDPRQCKHLSLHNNSSLYYIPLL